MSWTGPRTKKYLAKVVRLPMGPQREAFFDSGERFSVRRVGLLRTESGVCGVDVGRFDSLPRAARGYQGYVVSACFPLDGPGTHGRAVMLVGEHNGEALLNVVVEGDEVKSRDPRLNEVTRSLVQKVRRTTLLISRPHFVYRNRQRTHAGTQDKVAVPFSALLLHHHYSTPAERRSDALLPAHPLFMCAEARARAARDPVVACASWRTPRKAALTLAEKLELELRHARRAG